MVLLFHYTLRYGQVVARPASTPPAVTLGWGDLGVQLFFIISGLVIFMTLSRSRGVWAFGVNRFARLFPVYWASVAITWLTLRIFPMPGRSVPLRDALWNLTMIPSRLGHPLVDGVYWSLQVELSFYALMALSFALGLRRLAMLPVAAFCIAHGAGLQIFWGFTTAYSSLFLIGMVIYDSTLRRDEQGQPPRFDWRLHAPLLGVALADLVLHQVLRRGENMPHPGWTYPLAVAVFAGVVWAAARFRVPILSSAPLVYLGTISYSTYLIHQNVGYVVLRACESRGVPYNAAIGAATLVCLTLASALTFGVERPAQRFVRRLAGPHPGGVSASTPRHPTS